MAERVVDELEAIEIDHRHRELPRKLCAVGQRAAEGEPVGRLGQRIVVRHVDRAAFVRGELMALLLELDDLRGERLAGFGEFAVAAPAVRERAGHLRDLGDFERLGDVEDLVGGAGRLGDLDRREIGIARDDDEIDVGVELADPRRGFLAVDAGRHAHVDEGDGIGFVARQCGLDRRNAVEPLHRMRQREVDRGIGRGVGSVVVFAEQFGSHRLERAGVDGRRRETAPVAVVHGRFVIDDQNSHTHTRP